MEQCVLSQETHQRPETEAGEAEKCFKRESGKGVNETIIHIMWHSQL